MKPSPELEAIADAEIPACLRRRADYVPPPIPPDAPSLSQFMLPSTSSSEPKAKPKVSAARKRNEKDRAYAFVWKLMRASKDSVTIGQIMKEAPEGVEQPTVKSALRRLIREKQITSDGRWYQRRKA
jgi:hypothetical protein